LCPAAERTPLFLAKRKSKARGNNHAKADQSPSSLPLIDDFESACCVTKKGNGRVALTTITSFRFPLLEDHVQDAVDLWSDVSSQQKASQSKETKKRGTEEQQ
jgi:hypothetical protein